MSAQPDPAPRLGPWVLGAGKPALRLPGYDRAAMGVGIVHIGLGAFHRAHQAVYTDDVLATDPSWGIAGISLRSPDMRDALEPQGGLYTLIERSADGPRHRIVGSVLQSLVAPENPGRVIDLLAAPATRIVTITVSEKGYCRNAAGSGLDTERPDIRADIDLGHPRTLPGLLVAALARRRGRGLPPFAVLSCDNLPANGKLTRTILLEFARLVDSALADWMERELATPCSMVDRIVPRTTDADRTEIAARFGYHDAWPVAAEPFSQWVLEDRFPLGRPAWERAGAIFSDEVAAFETMKLRLLNGSHSALAYLGLLLGLATVSEAMGVPLLRRFVADLAEQELLPTLTVPTGQDAIAYIASLHARFANPAIQHHLLQIAEDGSQKLPQRLLAAAAQRIAHGADAPRIATVLAAWIACWRGAAVHDEKLRLSDPCATALLHAAMQSQPADAVLRVATPASALLGNRAFEAAVNHSLQRIESAGLAAVLVQGEPSRGAH